MSNRRIHVVLMTVTVTLLITGPFSAALDTTTGEGTTSVGASGGEDTTGSAPEDAGGGEYTTDSTPADANGGEDTTGSTPADANGGEDTTGSTPADANGGEVTTGSTPADAGGRTTSAGAGGETTSAGAGGGTTSAGSGGGEVTTGGPSAGTGGRPTSSGADARGTTGVSEGSVTTGVSEGGVTARDMTTGFSFGMGTGGSQGVTDLLPTTPSFESVMADLGLDTDSDSVDMNSLLGSLNSLLDGGNVSSAQLVAFASTLSQVTADAGSLSADEMSSTLDTLDSIFSLNNGDLQATKDLARSVVNALGNVLDAATNSDSSPGTTSLDNSQSKGLVSKTARIVDSIGSALAGSLNASSPPVTMKSSAFGMTVVKRPANETQGLRISAGFGSLVLDDHSDHGADLAFQALTYAKSPFAFATNNDLSDSPPLNFKVIGQNVSVPFKASSPVNKTIPSAEFDTSNITEDGIVTSYGITDLDSYMKISLRIPNDTNDYWVRCQLKMLPTAANSSIEIHIQDNKANVTTNLYNATVSYRNTTGTMIIFLNARTVGEKGMMYVCLSPDLTHARRRKRSTADDSTYSSAAAVYAPRVWDEKTSSWIPSDKLEIDPSSTGQKIVFKSNFMGSITSGLIIPPNTIDFGSVFTDLGAKTAENPGVLIVICVLIGLYLILLIPIRRADIKYYEQWKFLPILHNAPSDKYIYELTIKIGSKSSSEFDTTVFCVMYGRKGKTTPKALVDGTRKNFKPGKLTNLIVTCSENIGEITHIHIWTCARDERDSLFIDYIQICDLDFHKIYTLNCDDWISPVKGPGYGHEILVTKEAMGENFKKLMKKNAKKKIFDSHLWLSVIKRPNRSNFSRTQRLSLCLSTLFLTMVVNAMWFKTDNKDDNTPTISIGPVRLSFRTFYVSLMGSLIVIPPAMIISFLFQRSKPYLSAKKNRITHSKESTTAVGLLPAGIFEVKMDGRKDKRIHTADEFDLEENSVKTEEEIEEEMRAIQLKKNRAFTIPWWGVIVGYILVGLCIATGGWFCYLYSIQWGKELANEWLASLFLSIFQSILVIQPIKVILTAVILSVILRDSFDEPDGTSKLLAVSDLYGVVIPPESREPPVVPQEVAKVDTVRNYKEMKLGTKLFNIVKRLIAHFLYLGLLLTVVSHNTSTSFYYQNTALKLMFGLDSVSLSRIEDIWPWLRSGVLPVIYPLTLYNGNNVTSNDKKFIANMDGLLLGPVRLKQNREQSHNCDMAALVKNSINMKVSSCLTQEEKGNWTARWNHTYLSGFVEPPYIYEARDGFPYSAPINGYDKGGYTISMLRETYMPILNLLESQTWIDKQTRALFVEFVINNMNVNTFTQVKIVLELPIYGGVFASYQVNSFRPYPYVTVWDFVFLVIQCIWGVVLIYIFVTEVLALRRLGFSSYIQDPWNWVEAVNMLLAVLSIIFYTLRTLEVIKAIEFMMNNKGTYTDFDDVRMYDSYYALCVALVLFLAILQLFKPMDFSQQLAAIKMALQSTAGILLTYVTIFALMLLFFSMALHASQGNILNHFKAVMPSMYYLMLILLGIINYSDIFEHDTGMLRVIFATFMVVGNFFLLNMFVAIINEGLTFMKDHPDAQGFDVTLNQFIKSKMNQWWNSLSGAYSKKISKFAKVRRGGPWTREHELYHSLIANQNTNSPITENQFAVSAADAEWRSKQMTDRIDGVVKGGAEITLKEREAMPVCSCSNHTEHVVRLAVKSLVWEMALTNDKIHDLIGSKNTKSRRQRSRVDNVSPMDVSARDDKVFHKVMNACEGKIGPDGGELTVVPGLSVTINKETFSAQSLVKVQLLSSDIFTSAVIRLESELPLGKPFICCLPFLDGKKREYCNVFIKREDGPWTLTYNSVSCFSDSISISCHPKSTERLFFIGAKSAPTKTIHQAGQQLKEDMAAIKAVEGLNSDEGTSGFTQVVVPDAAALWKAKAEKATSDHEPSNLHHLELV